MKTLSESICELKNIFPEFKYLNRWTYQPFFNPKNGKFVLYGDKQGTCCLCGKKTNKGFKKKFGANFTAGPEVSMGTVICEYCHPLIKMSNELRRSMWLITPNELKKFKKAEAKEIVLNLPDEPFFLYLTNTWQKVGWVKMCNMVNHRKDGLICCCVDYDTYFVELEVIQDLFKLVEKLRELKIPKSELESGELSMHHYKKLENPRETSGKLKNYAGNPVWKLCVYLNK